ncbi:MAG: Oxidoreductase [Candidatus Taylorbacteria bacterium]|nr:Oxidoreductase [Candidatus Taylorbacteria bacterium]
MQPFGGILYGMTTQSIEATRKFFDTMKSTFKGDIDYADKTLDFYSHDASLFEVRPQIVVYPKDSADVCALVKWVNENRAIHPGLSITARSGGTDMTGGSINTSIIMDFTRSMNAIGEITDETGTVQPGCFYRNFEAATMKRKRYMPTYPASREICAVGGMVANNSGGEKSIKFGKTADHIRALKVVFNDGKEYSVTKMTVAELKAKASSGSYEGGLYQKLWDLVQKNYDAIKAAKPDVSKNSSGYYLWDVYDKSSDSFDLCRLIVGSQGTLGIITEITFELVPVMPHSNMLVAFLPDLSKLSLMINEILPFGPDSLESYDDYSMVLAFKFFFDFFKELGFVGAIKLGLRFIPDMWTVIASGRIPKLILMAEFTGESETEIKAKLVALNAQLKHFKYKTHITSSSEEAEKYWRVRRESFNLLRKHVHNKRTAPFIDDIIVKPEYLPEFLPRVTKLIDSYHLEYTIAGHPGNGNFHIIPLMDLHSAYSAQTILELSKKVYDLVHEYKGSISAEHNDGIIRTPYLLQMFGQEMVDVFRETKEIFDPNHIFNPGKKVGGTFEDIRLAIK